jgi:hypothetical protein
VEKINGSNMDTFWGMVEGTKIRIFEIRDFCLETPQFDAM